MAIIDKLVDLANAMGFGQLLADKIDQVPNEVEVADSANVVGSVTEEGLESIIQGSLQSHIDNKDNPHLDTAAMLGVYEKAYMDSEIFALLDQGAVPLSRFGSLNYLPINLSGETVGNVDLFPAGSFPMQVEADGTLVYLRLATNGTKRDLYYAYVDNAMQSVMQSESMSMPVYTSNPYRPVGFPANTANSHVRDVLASFNGVVAFIVEHGENDRDYMFALTNGTLDDKQHSVFYFNLTELELGSEPLSSLSFFRMTDAVVGDKVFVIRRDLSGTTEDPYRFHIYACDLTLYAPGDTVSFVNLTNTTAWTATGVDGNASPTSTNGSITFAQRRASANVSGTKFIDLQGDITSVTPFRDAGLCAPIIGSDGLVRIVVSHACRFANSTSSTSFNLGFTFVLDFSDNTATIASNQYPVLVSENAGVISTSNTGQTVNQLFTYLRSFSAAGGFTYFDRYLFVLETTQSNNQPMLHAVTLGGTFTDAFTNLLRADSPFDDAQSTRTIAKFVGPIGSDQRGVTLLNDSFMLVNCNGTNANGENESFSLTNKAFGIVKTDYAVDNYQYPRDSDPYDLPMEGYPPANPRYRLNDLTAQVVAPFALQSEMSKLGQITSQANTTVTNEGCWLIEGYRTNIPRYVSVDVNGVPVISSERITIANSVFVQPTDDIIVAESLSTVVAQTRMEVFFPVTTVGGENSFVVLTVRTTTNELHFFIYNASLTLSTVSGSISITQITIGSRIGSRFASGVAVGPVLVDNRSDTRSGSISIHQFGSDKVIGGCSAVSTTVIGNSYSCHFLIKFTQETLAYTLVAMRSAPSFVSTSTYFALPAKGVGYLYSDLSPLSETATRTVFLPFAKSIADIDAFDVNRYAGDPYTVVTSTAFPEGFSVIFPEPLPVIILGTTYELPATVIDFATVLPDPSNATFYLFVEINEDGDAVYVVSSTPRADDIGSIYIGSVTTNATGIESINLEKVTKIAEYRLSTTPKGLAIPASLGNPHTTSAIDPAWY